MITKKIQILGIFLSTLLFAPLPIMGQSAPNMEGLLNSIVGGYSASRMSHYVFFSQTAIDALAVDYASSAINNATFQQGLQNQLSLNSGLVAKDIRKWLHASAPAMSQAFEQNFGDFGLGLSRFYGDAMLFTHHLVGPVGYDHLEEDQLYSGGLGLGIGFSNVRNLSKNSTGDSSTIFQTISVLPAATIGVNMGVKLTPKLDLRLSLFPNSYVNLPVPSIGQDKFDIKFNFSAYKARLNLNLLPGKKYDLGACLTGFGSYTNGAIVINTREVAQPSQTITGTSTTADTSMNYQVTTTPYYKIGTESTWEYYTVGPEIKIWYNLDFFIPYMGYALAFQFGQFNSTMRFHSKLDITQNVDTTVLATAETFTTTNQRTVYMTNDVQAQTASSLMMHRIYFGTEIRLLSASMIVEFSVNPISQMIGAGTSFQVAF